VKPKVPDFVSFPAWTIAIFASLLTVSSTARSQQSSVSLDDSASVTEALNIPIGDFALTASAWGEGELVVALPGVGADNVRYRIIGPLIAAEGYRVVAVNQRGIRSSGGNLIDLTLHDYAADVAEIIHHFSATKAHLIGWAFGNRIQRTVATDYPERVATVTLLAAGGLFPPTAEPGALGRLLSEPALALEERMSLARMTLFSPATSDATVREYAASLTYWPEARLSQQAASRATPREEWWGGGEAPMLVVQGIDDMTAPVENGRQMLAAYGDRIELVEIAGAGHLMGLEKPEETAASIITFLKTHPI